MKSQHHSCEAVVAYNMLYATSLSFEADISCRQMLEKRLNICSTRYTAAAKPAAASIEAYRENMAEV